MEMYIYDIEIYACDWIVIFKHVNGTQHTVIHNDVAHLREFLKQPNIVIGGFNNKHYDDWVMMTILSGATNSLIKQHNDFIIGGGNGWEFKAIQFQKKPFVSFDLKDDTTDPALSLKAIEGNLNLPIVECDIPFNLDRPLTDAERDEVIKYCKHDVDATVELFKQRADYIQSKLIVAEMYNIPPAEALKFTNAKLCARVFNAKKVVRNDERSYKIPKEVNTSLIPTPILEFFERITDKSIADEKLFSSTFDCWIETSAGKCPVTYAWGGVHGAKPCYTIEATDDLLIINFDVSSLYPSSIINFGYASRNISDPKAYETLVKRRLKFKADGDDEKAGALKLVVNTFYGAMLNQFNDLVDRLGGRSVCITNQLCMTMLINMLGQSCKSIDFININTDGIMFSIRKSEEQTAAAIIDSWCKLTRFEMERTDFKKVIQKDVNNYIAINAKGKIKTKGGFVSLYKKGNFKTNSLQIIHRAIVDNLLKNVKPETTINAETDIFKFQQIVKTGGTYDGTYHYINGERQEVQRVNRIYAVKDYKYGKIVKGKLIKEKRKKNKETGKFETIPVEPPIWSESTISECPDHAFIDNENTLSIKDLDKQYYIDMAYRRIKKYQEIDSKVANKLKKITEVIKMTAVNQSLANDDLNVSPDKNIYTKLNTARIKFLNSNVKKSGINRFAEFKYFELSDIVPVATQILNELKLSFLISFDNDIASGQLIDCENPFGDSITFKMPMATLNVKGMNEIQALGAVQTYQRRYLYMLLLDIVESDQLDAVMDKPNAASDDKEPVQLTKKSNRPVSTEQREEIKKELINEDSKATDVQIKSIKAGLKKLRAKDDKYETFVIDTVKRIKTGLSKADAESLLIEIGNKIEED